MTVEMNMERIYSELGRLRQDVQGLRDIFNSLGQTKRPSLRTDHPHIVRIEGLHGGRPVIRGAGVSVRTIVEQSRLGRAPEGIVEDFDGVLTLAQVYDALSYAYEHQGEIEQDITNNRAALRATPLMVSRP
jgi:uncharacterized protein (DUF433 family)